MNFTPAGHVIGHSRRRRLRRGLAGILVGLIAVGASPLLHGQSTSDRHAQRMINNSATGVVLPQTPLNTDAVLRARRSSAWSDGPVQRLLLEDDVQVNIGGYGFNAHSGVVFATSRPTLTGRVYDLAIYLDDVRELGGQGAIRAEAPRLLVTVSVSGEVVLHTDKFDRRSLADDDFVRDAMARVQRYRRAQVERIAALGQRPPLYPLEVLARRDRPHIPPRRPAVTPDAPGAEPSEAAASSVPTVETAPPDVEEQVAASEPPAPPAGRTTPPTDGDVHPEAPEDLGQLQRVQFRADKIVYEELDGEAAAVLMGDVQVLHHDLAAGRSLSLSSDRAVIFTAPGALTGGTTVEAQTVRGVYLEDNVIATDGEYTLRGPRVFFDVLAQRAVVLDAVFYTWSIERQVPLYIRARKLMQVSRSQWQAERGRLSTSEFHEPHFAIGVDHLTVNREAADDERAVYRYEARGATLRYGDTPLFYWPRITGQTGDTPLRRASVSFDTQDGVVLRTRWDAFALAGADAPEGVDATFLLDGFTERGVATGVELDYDVPKAFGDGIAYGMYDTGEDEPGGRDEIDPQTDTRGVVHWQHRHLLPDDWQVSLELSWISDPTFLEEFFTSEAYTDKPWETSFYAKKQDEDWAFTFLTRYDLLDFLPQLPRLQTPGYTVDKLPELAYYRIGTPLFGDTVTWFSENRGSLMAMNFPEQAPRELGFNRAESLAIFGVGRGVPLDQALGARGFEDDHVARFDTRQELNLPLKLGPIDIVPYVVGRATVYDDDFAEFRGEQDNARLWGQGGARLHTALTRNYDSVESRLLDLHRLRHIIEPFVNVSYADTNIEQQNLPVYDFNVESLSDGLVTKLGLRNTWQTQRGGPGNWRSVDVFRLDTEFVIQDEDIQVESPIARFFDYRPEYSLAGDHFYTEMAWQVSDTLSAVSNLNYSFDTSEVERWNAGVLMDHNPRLTSFMELRHISDLDSLLFRYGFEYLLSTKYHLAFSQAFDFDRNEVRDLNVELTRRLPRALFRVIVSVDEVGDVSSVGVAFSPEGGGSRGHPSRNPFIYTR